jgi:3-oxoacid CoA-transferase subunit A
MKKIFRNSDEAVADIPDGASIMVGGFGLCGIPENLIRALVRKHPRDLHIISNNAGVDSAGLGLLLEAGMVGHLTASYIGENSAVESGSALNDKDLTLVPEGTLAERIRASGAGIPAFFTPAGVGTQIENGKEVRRFGERDYLLELALSADFALVKAWRGDPAGNLVYRRTARNFNPAMATAAKITIAEVEDLVETGDLDADAIVTPGIYVKRIVKGELYERRIERRTTAR